MHFIWYFIATYTWLHSTTILSCFANCCSKEWIISSLFFDCSLRNVISSCNCFIKLSEFSTITSLPQEIRCLFLKESTSVKNDDFRASNPSITESLNFDYSLLTLILNDLLHCFWLFEYWVLFGKNKQVHIPTSFSCTEWYFINLSRISSKCSFVNSLSMDSCTKCKTSSLAHFSLLCY